PACRSGRDTRGGSRRSGKPAVLGFPAGHVTDNATLPHGARVRLDADKGTLEIVESPCVLRRSGEPEP
ncbi:MAG: hypothetical protein ACKON7_12500, partial [Planctomycetaceae bacterium]